MAYVRRIVDGRIFEVFGTETHQVLMGREVVSMAYFFLYDAEATEDDEGNPCDGLWHWCRCTDFLPLEELVPDDEEEDTTPEGSYDMQDIEEDIPTPEQEDIKEDKL